jgi:hypothetical protein
MMPILVKKFPALYETEASLLSSQEDTGPTNAPEESGPHPNSVFMKDSL